MNHIQTIRMHSGQNGTPLNGGVLFSHGALRDARENMDSEDFQQTFMFAQTGRNGIFFKIYT